MDEAPKAPWSPFPLVELVVLIALVLIVLGFVIDGPRRGALLGCGFALVTLAGLELAIREHVAGYRSHSTLLAGTVFVLVTGGLLYLAGLPLAISLPVGVVAFVAAFLALRAAFRRASGGLSYKVGGLRG